MNPSVPSMITGGCLCGKVRYEVTFAPNHDFREMSHSCQCTDCRKQSGSLIIHWHSITAQELKWTSKATLVDYSHTPGRHRFFCRECGGTLVWQDEKDEDGFLEFTVGTVDEKWLVGKDDAAKKGEEQEEKEDGDAGRYGIVLADPEGTQFWSARIIKGVTDNLPGKKKQ